VSEDQQSGKFSPITLGFMTLPILYLFGFALLCLDEFILKTRFFVLSPLPTAVKAATIDAYYLLLQLFGFV